MSSGMVPYRDIHCLRAPLIDNACLSSWNLRSYFFLELCKYTRQATLARLGTSLQPHVSTRYCHRASFKAIVLYLGGRQWRQKLTKISTPHRQPSRLP